MPMRAGATVLLTAERNEHEGPRSSGATGFRRQTTWWSAPSAPTHSAGHALQRHHRHPRLGAVPGMAAAFATSRYRDGSMKRSTAIAAGCRCYLLAAQRLSGCQAGAAGNAGHQRAPAPPTCTERSASGLDRWWWSPVPARSTAVAAETSGAGIAPDAYRRTASAGRDRAAGLQLPRQCRHPQRLRADLLHRPALSRPATSADITSVARIGKGCCRRRSRSTTGHLARDHRRRDLAHLRWNYSPRVAKAGVYNISGATAPAPDPRIVAAAAGVVAGAAFDRDRSGTAPVTTKVIFGDSSEAGRRHQLEAGIRARAHAGRHAGLLARDLRRAGGG